jgi:hypothetical protein
VQSSRKNSSAFYEQYQAAFEGVRNIGEIFEKAIKLGNEIASDSDFFFKNLPNISFIYMTETWYK